MELYEILSLIINLLVVITGCFAIIVYRIQESNKVKTAARLVMSQIKQIEGNVLLLKNTPNLNAHAVYASKSLLPNNYWEENRHLLTRKFDDNQKQIIDNFYSSAEEIEKARHDICIEMTNTWNNKDLVFQYMLMNGINDEETNEILVEKLNEYDQSSKVYFPKLPIDHLIKNLSAFQSISGTVVFDKLYKLSK